MMITQFDDNKWWCFNAVFQNIWLKTTTTTTTTTTTATATTTAAKPESPKKRKTSFQIEIVENVDQNKPLFKQNNDHASS